MMYPQEILRYVGFGFLILSAVLAALSIVVFVSRDVRGALRFLRGGPSVGTNDASLEHRSLAMHKSHVITRSTRESLAMAEGDSSTEDQRVSYAQFVDDRFKDSVQDAMETVVDDATQDDLATVVVSDAEDDVATIVGDLQTYVEPYDLAREHQPNDFRVPETAESGFAVVREIVITNVEIDIDMIMDWM
jgi:hypothetical protein